MSGRRGGLLALSTTGLLLGLWFACGGGEETPAPALPTGERAARDWSEDDRLRPLLHACPGQGRFNGDTSDMLPILVGKLQSSTRIVLRNVREELAASGPPAIEELARLVRRLYTDPHGSHAIVNALGVLQMSEDGGIPAARALLGTCLGHPQETVRTAAIRALTEHSAPELYDDLKALVAITQPQMFTSLWQAMYRADPVRFEGDLAAWIEAGEHSAQWSTGARLVASGASEETAGRLAVAATTVTDPEARAFLLAALSRRDGEGALEPLLSMLEDENAQLRMTALTALAYTTAVEPVAATLRGDDRPELRGVAAGQLAAHADEPVVREALRDGLNDPDDATRLACLKALLLVGDEAAADYTLTLLGGGRRDLELGLRSLAGTWDANPGLADRARDLLGERLAELNGHPLKRQEPLIQAIGSMPGAATARFLLELATTVEAEQIHGRSGHRWLAEQANNSGPEGREVLMEAWRTEEDLVRRMDLLWPATSGHDDATRAFLTEVLLADRTAPHERLYAAERLACEGPAAEVAPLLKRVTRRMNDPVFRPAMECLLWRWYG